eukprot:SAG31_NODE_3043_length_4753_cov_3.006016_4_plen_829_part_00
MLRLALIKLTVCRQGDGVLPTRSVPDQTLTYPSDPGLLGLVWNLTTIFPITSTVRCPPFCATDESSTMICSAALLTWPGAGRPQVFYSPAIPGKKSKSAFMFHHGHSDCKCPNKPGDVPWMARLCRPGCNSSMPSLAEISDPGYSWWDLYNVSNFYHSLGHDVFILSMPLKGVNSWVGEGAVDHWWFLQWEKQGDAALRYFLEPCVLTVNWAKAQGYRDIHMAGLSGGGWSTTFAAAIDKRINASFPIAGSTPCGLRSPNHMVVGQVWTGGDEEDFEQSCAPHDQKPHVPNTCRKHWGDYPEGCAKNNSCTGIAPLYQEKECPGRPAFSFCNYTCQYLLASLEPERYQVQILHEYDTCCFSPHGRHDKMLAYEANIRAELAADDRADPSKHGWFTTTADNHSKHEVCAQDKTIMTAALARKFKPGDKGWEALPCDIMHQPLPGGTCAQNVDPGLPPGYEPKIPTPEPKTEPGYTLLGFGGCTDGTGKTPAAVGNYTRGNNTYCAAICSADSTCLAYVSTEGPPTALCRFYCSAKSDAKHSHCDTVGDGGGKPTTADGGDWQDKVEFCWGKTMGTRASKYVCNKTALMCEPSKAGEHTYAECKKACGQGPVATPTPPPSPPSGGCETDLHTKCGPTVDEKSCKACTTEVEKAHPTACTKAVVRAWVNNCCVVGKNCKATTTPALKSDDDNDGDNDDSLATNLKIMTSIDAYAINASQNHDWVSLGGSNDWQQINEFARHGVPTLLHGVGEVWQRDPMPHPEWGQKNNSRDLVPGWEAIVEKWAKTVALPFMHNGTVIGVYIGDELCSHNIYPVSLSLSIFFFGCPTIIC